MRSGSDVTGFGAPRCAIPSTFRGRWRGVVVLGILIGVAGGCVLTAWEGARRTQSALPRMLDATNAADVSVGVNLSILGLSRYQDFSRLATLPGVVRAGKLYGFGITPWSAHTLESEDFGAYSNAPADRAVGRTFDAPLVLEGRLPAVDKADEVVVNDAALAQIRENGFSPRIGARVPLAWFNFGALFAMSKRLGDRQPTPQQINEVFHVFDGRIVGRVRLPNDVVANQNQVNPAILLGPEFGRLHARDASYSSESLVLRDRSALGAFERAARAEYPKAGLRFTTPGDLRRSFDAIAQPYVDAMRVFALVAAITTTLVLAQALVRQARGGAAEAAKVRALGASRRDLTLITGARGAATAIAGTLLALASALVLSGRFPIGPARAAEPDPGLRVDPYVLAVGGAAMLIVLLATVAIASAHVARASDLAATGARKRRPRRVFERAPSVASRLGLARAFDGGGGLSSTSLGVTFVGVVVAITTCFAAIGFGAALNGFVSHPDRWGWHWDAMYDSYDTELSSQAIAVIDHLPQATAVTIGTRGTIAVGSTTIAAFGLDVVRGDAAPIVLEGRLPAAEDEIAFGARSMRDQGALVGSRIEARSVDGRPIELKVVGRAVIPPSLDLSETHRLGQGAILTRAGLARIDPAPAPSFALINLRDRSKKTFDAAARGLPAIGSLLRTQRPSEVASYAGVRSTPRFLALLLGLLAVGVLAHVLISSARARRREFALLKAIGVRRRQVASSVMWEATALVCVAAAAGLFFGLIASRLIWHRFTDDLGVRAVAVVPVGAWILAVAALIVVANLIAVIPARSSARLNVTKVLRSE